MQHQAAAVVVVVALAAGSNVELLAEQVRIRRVVGRLRGSNGWCGWVVWCGWVERSTVLAAGGSNVGLLAEQVCVVVAARGRGGGWVEQTHSAGGLHCDGV